jgi:predicted anti-sigma-YlaC factor YlaD
MKRCRKLKTAQRYIDGELTAAGNESFEAHLATCCDCRNYYDETLALKTAISHKQPAAPPYLFEEKLLRNVSEAGTARPAEYFWDTVGALSRKLIPATLLLCFVMSVTAIITLPSSLNVRQTRTAVSSYYNYSFKNHEKAFLASDGEKALGNLYTALNYKKTAATTYKR